MELVQAPLQVPERIDHTERADQDRRGRAGPDNRRVAFRAGPETGKAEWEIALDGKVMRGAWTDENDKVTLFSAMLHREAVTIAQVRVPDGTNEITQADAILDTVEIPAGESVLVTLDAAHTQRETAETIGGKPGWDYLMTVKGNQPSLQREVFDRILPADKRNPARRHGGTRPRPDQNTVLLDHQCRRNRLPARTPGRHYPP